MDVIFPVLSLRIIITVLTVGSTHLHLCSSTADIPFNSQHQQKLAHKHEFDEGEEFKDLLKGNDKVEEEDEDEEQNHLRLMKDPTGGPIQYPLDFNKPDYSGQMSFRQAVVLAREEAKCLDEFGSRTKKTAVEKSINGALAQRLLASFGCFQPDTETQCEQCKNITAQPFETLDECHHLCNIQDVSCRRMCFNVYKTLRNSTVDANDFELSIREDEDYLSVLEDNGTASNSPIDSSKSKIADGSTKQRRGHLIQSVGVFCEGVNNLSSDNDKIHFVILKWNINETGFQRFLENSSYADSHDISILHNNEFDLDLNSKRGKLSPLVYVIEQKSGNRPEWKTIGKTSFRIQKVNVSYNSDNYTWRITAVGRERIEDMAVTKNYVTLDGYKEPGPPKTINVVETKGKNSSVDVLIGWEPPAEKACCYKIVLERTSGGKEMRVRIKQPLGLHMYWFEDLSYGTTYHVQMTSRDLSWSKFESTLANLEFKTPTCLESFNYRFDKCAPSPPSGIKHYIEPANLTTNQQFLVTLTWLPPLNASDRNPVDKYGVQILHQGLTTHKGNYTVQTVPGNTTKLTVKNLRPDTGYFVMITAYSIRGGSSAAEYSLNTKLEESFSTNRGSAVKVESSQEAVGNWIYVTVTFITAVLLLLLCNMVRIYINKRNVKIARNQYFQSMEERDEMGADWSIVPLTEYSSNWKLFDENFPKEKWEIAWDDMTMGEVIGQGAFGVVRRAKIHRRKLELKLKIRGDDETWFNSADRHTDEADPEMETVAVKMVKVSSTRDDREQLIKEITMMQSLGFHSQIVGLLGACTKGRNLCLVLEYCPGGDLLTFVRKVRAKYWPTLGLSESKMANSPFNLKRGITAGMKANSGSGGREGSVSSLSDNRKSFDSSPINYADIGGFSASCSSPENSATGCNGGENSKNNFFTAGNSKSEHSSIPPFFVNQSEQEFEEDDEFRPIDEKDVLSYARQIAMGMEYLEKNRVVHRDLASRNVLLMGDYKHVKISDFGLSRDIYTWNVYHQKSNGKLPIKWMAIESIFTHIFTTKSDVWSYGILLWELVTLGGTPYPGLGNTELFHLLKSGYRMERPDNCSEELYAVMKKCWRTAAASRPSFTELRRHVETMMEAAEPNLYLSLMADLPVDYFQLSSRSDIPLVGKVDEISTPLKDSPTGSFSTNHNFATRHRHNSSFSTGKGANNDVVSPSESDYGGESTKRRRHNEITPASHPKQRKPQSLYHNTCFSHRDSDSRKITGSRFVDQSNVELPFHHKEYENKEVTSRASFVSSSSTETHKTTSSTSSSRTVANVISSQDDSNSMSISGGNYRTAEGQFLPNTKDHGTFTRFDPATFTNAMNKNAPQRMPSTSSSQYEPNDTVEQGGESSQRRPSIQSSDSGILVQRTESGSGNNYDLEQISFAGELENVFEEVTEGCGGGEGWPKQHGTVRQLTTCRSLEVDGSGSVRSPISATSNAVRLPDRSCSFNRSPPKSRLVGQASMPQIQKRPKLSLPFVTVNNMTIVGNRSYDLRDT